TDRAQRRSSDPARRAPPHGHHLQAREAPPERFVGARARLVVPDPPPPAALPPRRGPRPRRPGAVRGALPRPAAPTARPRAARGPAGPGEGGAAGAPGPDGEAEGGEPVVTATPQPERDRDWEKGVNGLQRIDVYDAKRTSKKVIDTYPLKGECVDADTNEPV